MISPHQSSPEFFEQKYAETADPWHFATDPYELGRYDRIVSVIMHRHYRRALEPACSVGVLTERLAPFCDAIEAFDFSPTAVAAARARCRNSDHVTFSCRSVLDCDVNAETDLLVLCEFGYYFDADHWACLVARLTSALQTGATVLAAHWLGSSSDHQMSGDEVHAILRATPLLRLEHEERLEQFRLDRLVRV